MICLNTLVNGFNVCDTLCPIHITRDYMHNSNVCIYICNTDVIIANDEYDHLCEQYNYIHKIDLHNETMSIITDEETDNSTAIVFNADMKKEDNNVLYYNTNMYGPYLYKDRVLKYIIAFIGLYRIIYVIL